MPVLDFGGVESRIAIQAVLMRERVNELRVCTFWRPGAAATRLESLGVAVDVLDVDPSIRNPRATWRLYSYLRRHRPDIIHCRIGEGNWHGLIAGTLARVPVRIAEEVGLPTRSGITKQVFPFLYHLAHRVVGISKPTCRFLIEEDGVDPSKVRLVHNTANPAFFDEPPIDTRADGSPFRTVAVGRLDQVKNQAMLIRAFATLHSSYPDTVLDIIGEGPERTALAALIDELDLGDSVQLLGFRDDVRSQLGSADLFVLPSHSEGLPVSLVEAMACEVPALGSDVGGVSEVMGELGDQFLLQPDDESAWTRAMEQMVLMSKTERNAIGQRARQQVLDHFSPQAYIANLEALYAEALEEQGLVT